MSKTIKVTDHSLAIMRIARLTGELKRLNREVGEVASKIAVLRNEIAIDHENNVENNNDMERE